MKQPRLLAACFATLVAAIVLGSPCIVGAQPPEEVRKAMEARAKAKAAAEGKSDSNSDDKKDDKDGKPEDKDGKDDKAKKDEEAKPKIITRPDAQEGLTADMSKLREQVGADGMVRFSLEGVPWTDLLRWLADASNLSLDWQELPGDTLNLRTQQPYTVEEARDVINRHLLSRGFTMLRHGELLSVIKIDKLNPGLIPRVRPEDLDERMPHEFAKVSFPLDWMIAEQAVEELKPMLSPNGKLTALTSTNRIEAIDAVVNLREIRTILQEEQTTTGDKRVVEVFHLQHVSAGETVGLLEQILGLETNRSMTGGIDDNASRMIMQQLQQMQRNMQGSGSKSSSGGGGDDEKPKLIVNDRDNSIVAHAPPDKMEIIRQTVLALDTPASRRGTSLHTKIFRLSTLDPAPLVSIINELGDFSPTTKIQADETNNSLIVQGTLSDLNSIWELIQELDGSTRNFEVIPLRRLAAEEVAGTIQYLMGSEDDDNKNQNSGYSYYSYRYGRGGGSEPKEDKRPFKVDADIENNRLLLWANEVELEEVQNLLVKMGEIPASGGSNETLRVIDFANDEDAEKVLERLRRMWPNMAPNELQIQPAPQRPTEEAAPSGSLPESKEPENVDEPRTETTAIKPTHPLLLAQADERPPVRKPRRTEPVNVAAPEPPANDVRRATERVLAQRTEQATAPSSRSSDAPPIVIQRGPDGKLIITSPDTQALDQLEGMLADIAPPRKDYHIFTLKYPQTWAYGVELNLKDFFKEEMDSTTSYDPYWGTPITQNNGGGSRLSQRKSLKIISDADSRTILVQGATPSQLATIADLIEIYDMPTSSDPQAMRTTKFFQLQYSNAQAVGDTLKAVYRDLLSTNDPSLRDPSGGDKESKPQGQGTTLTYVYNRGGSGEEEAGEEPSRITFQGLLSVGVDTVSNTLVVSSIEGLMPEITEIVETLDEAAKPAGNFRVVPLDPNINPALDQARLQKLLESKRQQQGQNGQPNGQNGGDGNNGPQNGNNNGRPNFGGRGR